jgi:hypothetical protein
MQARDRRDSWPARFFGETKRYGKIGESFAPVFGAAEGLGPVLLTVAVGAAF